MKARHFVLALHDYFGAKALNSDTQASVAVTNIHTASPSPAPSAAASDAAISDVALKRAFAASRAKKAAKDLWALKYINIRHVQPLLEAFDDDTTG